MLYTKKENNKIKAFAGQKENTIAITEEQWIKSGYGIYCDIINNKFVVIEPVDNLEKLKQEKIKELKNNCQNYIYSIYPVFKQMNIINPLSDYTNEDRKTMNKFIEIQRSICDQREEEINNINSKKELDNINTDFKRVENDE